MYHQCIRIASLETQTGNREMQKATRSNLMKAYIATYYLTYSYNERTPKRTLQLVRLYIKHGPVFQKDEVDYTEAFN